MKKALVTGGTGSIGNAIVSSLVNAGYFVYIHGFSHKYEKNLPNTQFVVGDISNEDDCRNIANEITSLDVLVNNAGLKCYRKNFEDFDLPEIKRMIDINLFGTLQITKILLPKINSNGSIINITSEAGTFGGNGIIPYAVTKAGLNIFTKALARETSGKQIRVNAISPGIIQTGEHPEEIINTIPLKRFGTPVDVAQAVLLLAKESYINGAILPITGGR